MVWGKCVRRSYDNVSVQRALGEVIAAFYDALGSDKIIRSGLLILHANIQNHHDCFAVFD